MKSRAAQLNEALTEGKKESLLPEGMEDQVKGMGSGQLKELGMKMKERMEEIGDMDGEAPFPADDDSSEALKMAEKSMEETIGNLDKVKEKKKK